jgi:hypothetical protein
MCGCIYKQRDFFKKMQPSFQDIEIDSGFYFIKDFGISQQSVILNGNHYWKLSNNTKSLFNLSGYVRKVNDSIMLLPLKYVDASYHETKLFDFSAKKNDNWKVISEVRNENYIGGDSITLTDIKPFANQDTVFEFTLRPFWGKKHSRLEYLDKTFILEVSKDKGIISIRKQFGFWNTFDYKVILFPKQKFFNNRPPGVLDL